MHLLWPGLQPEALSLQSLFVDAGKHIPGSAKFKNVDEMVSILGSLYFCVHGHNVLFFLW